MIHFIICRIARKYIAYANVNITMLLALMNIACAIIEKNIHVSLSMSRDSQST